MKAPVHNLALTGGIACGKSTALRLFAEEGAAVIDADDVAHRWMVAGAPGPGPGPGPGPEPGSGVPEPSTWALLLLGAAGLMYWRKRRENA